ncbi:MAG TPA: LPS export ABC transporter ATP-binding protein [Longimicrobium sp.]|nr:LPS export ABC transporter ATP-binding protein [Longimicrobium sp.]HSU18036.1 LPS export ABC transporter ATP-binding protein [Longimicrobium sp.]
MTEPRLERIVSATGAGGLSALMALRALAAADEGAHPVDRARWLTGVREEYHRWYGGDGQAPGNFASPETVRYLDEQVTGQLAAAGVVEFLAEAEGEPVSPDGAGTWQAVRLSPWALAEVQAGRERALQHMDARIRAILHDTHGSGHEGGESAAAVADFDGEAGGVALAPEDEALLHPQRRQSMIVPGGLTLAAKGLVKTYRGRRVVNDVDVHVRQGEIVGLLGPNGAGKTTSFYMIVGLIRPDRGKVFIGPRELTGVPMYKRARAGIGYLAQEPSIFRRLSVEENVMAILQMMPLSRAERKRRLEELLDELGIKHLRKTKAYALSGGERRRLEITRALVSQPRFMLLDEPFAGVDPIAVHDIQQIVSDLRRRGIGVLISDHNVEQTLDIVDRAYIMYEGRVRVSGTVSELVWNDEVAEIYLGPTLTARMRERYDHPESEDAV